MTRFKIQNSKFKTQNSIIPPEDFWSRQANALNHSLSFAPLGLPVEITANEPGLLAAAHLSAGRFSRAAGVEGAASRIQLVVRPGPAGPLLADLVAQLAYTGVGQWITLSAGVWGHGFASLSSREAVVVLSAALAAETRLVSRYFIDHYLLNFILTEWAMLHASCVLDPQRQRLVVLVAPHNTGKSTAALRLLQAGYQFLADGMVLLRWDETHRQFIVGGYPIGEVKLRDDVLALFPQYTGQVVQVREERKTIIDLRAIYPDRLIEMVFKPSSILLCFVERSDSIFTQALPLAPAAALPLVAANTVYWNEPAHLGHNSAALHALLRTAGLYRLRLGPEPDSLMAAVNDLP